MNICTLGLKKKLFNDRFYFYKLGQGVVVLGALSTLGLRLVVDRGKGAGFSFCQLKL